ncbi:MAG: 1-acyl-sn-glycerol-3-phosphate acyltransferase [Oceanicaulis sp.]|jgi:putative hemolysin|nr:1-acyl-sn-glycerol-3-phosphate acyltransferase [Oceanicaulis sp.]
MTGTDLTQSHVVDQLIEERAVRLSANPWAWPLIKRVFYPLLGYQRARSIADALVEKSGREAMDWAQDFLSMSASVDGLDHVPETGPCVITANHPGGISDGIAVWQALKARRPDMVFFANRDAIRVCEGLADVVIPVEWREGHRNREKTRDTLKRAITAFQDGRCVVVFPAGRMSMWDWRTLSLRDESWQPTAVSLARKFKAPIISLGVKQRMSLWFYGLGLIHEELRHMTVFHELLAKKGAHYRLNFGAPLDPLTLAGDEQVASETLRLCSQGLARTA